MPKKKIQSIHEKNTVIRNIISAMVDRKSFLLLGHKNPDEDCIASMVAFAILLIKFDKPVQIFISGKIPENVKFLANICIYNSIRIIDSRKRIAPGVDTVITCDTPKPTMLDTNTSIDRIIRRRGVINIEIDHHLGADSDYIGDEGYRLVTEASSASELVGILAIKLKGRKDILRRFMIADPFSRNFVLAILTGIIGDTNMGKYLKSRREKKFYEIFSGIYNDILMRTTVKESNFTRIEDVYRELQTLSEKEAKCYGFIIKKQQLTGAVAWILLNARDMTYLHKNFDGETITNAIKSIVNDLAELSQKVGIISFPDKAGPNRMIQFRMRRSHEFKSYDLRTLLETFSVKNGGGHEGAIGFRFPHKEIRDPLGYLRRLVDHLEEIL